MKAIETKRPRRLDLNAPLLSTRRPYLSVTTNIEISRTCSRGRSCDMVPFLWEQSPGKPKNTASREIFKDKALPLPKPPPIRWQEEPILPNGSSCYGDADDYEDDNEDEYDNNGEANNDDNDDATFSDAIDLLSLAESLNTTGEIPTIENAREDLDFESDTDDREGSFSPNFMIQRFLPAATALAASSLSALAANKDLSNTTYSSNKHLSSVYPSSNFSKEGLSVPRVAGEAYSSTKGCGLELLFPWRAKHRLCGAKSPVRRVRASLKPQLSPKNK